MTMQVQGKKKSHSDSQFVVGILSQIQADIFTIYVKTLGCHWNMVDPRFFFLHKMLEEQYEALAEEVDVVAERIRQLGGRAPCTLRDFSHLTREGELGKEQTGNEMLKSLIESYESFIARLQEEIRSIDEYGDIGTTDMLTQISRAFEKRLWILKSHF